MLAHQISRLKSIFHKVIRRLAGVLTLYGVYQARASSVPPASSGTTDADSVFKTVLLDESWLARIEAIRPSYSPMAIRYFSENHICFAVLAGGEITTMGWLTKPSNIPEKVLDYYPLPSKTSWLHADWTSSSWRGRGLHRRLIHARAQYALANGSVPDPILECNIESSNLPSILNYERMGFERTSRILVLRIPRCPVFAWRLI